MSKSANDLAAGVASNREALKRVLQFGLTGAGVGAAGAGLMGIRDFMTRQSPIPAASRLGGLRPAVIRVGPPEEAELEERKRQQQAAMSKAAGEEDLIGDVTKLNPEHFPRSTGSQVGDTLSHVLGGSWTNNAVSKPWFLPAAVGAAGAGIYGGYKGIQGFLNWRRKTDREAELAKARNEYRNALISQYSAGTKAGSAESEMSRELDELAREKVANSTLQNAGGAALGGYLTLAGLLAGGAGLGTYAYTKANAPENRLAKAIQQRERMRWATRPPEIYAVGRSKIEPEEKEEQPGVALGPRLKMSHQQVAELYKVAGS